MCTNQKFGRSSTMFGRGLIIRTLVGAGSGSKFCLLFGTSNVWLLINISLLDSNISGKKAFTTLNMEENSSMLELFQIPLIQQQFEELKKNQCCSDIEMMKWLLDLGNKTVGSNGSKNNNSTGRLSHVTDLTNGDINETNSDRYAHISQEDTAINTAKESKILDDTCAIIAGNFCSSESFYTTSRDYKPHPDEIVYERYVKFLSRKENSKQTEFSKTFKGKKFKEKKRTLSNENELLQGQYGVEQKSQSIVIDNCVATVQQDVLLSTYEPGKEKRRKLGQGSSIVAIGISDQQEERLNKIELQCESIQFGQDCSSMV